MQHKTITGQNIWHDTCNKILLTVDTIESVTCTIPTPGYKMYCYIQTDCFSINDLNLTWTEIFISHYYTIYNEGHNLECNINRKGADIVKFCHLELNHCLVVFNNCIWYVNSF